MNDTPRCNALESNPLDSFDYRAWVTLAKQLERELDGCRHERNVLQKICAERSDEIERLNAARPEGEAQEAKRYRAWRDGDVIVRRSPSEGWEARHCDSPHWDVGSWYWSLSLDEVIDKALREPALWHGVSDMNSGRDS